MILVESETTTLVLNQHTDTLLVGNIEREVVVDSKDTTILVKDPEVTSLFVGAPGPQGPPGNVGEVQFNRIVSPTATEIVDGVAIALVDGCQWNVIIADRVQNKRRFQSVYATHELGTNAFFSVGPILGSRLTEMPYSIDVVISSGFMNLTVNNTGANDLIVEVVRLKVDAVNT